MYTLKTLFYSIQMSDNRRNFTLEEKELLLEYVKKEKGIIENKNLSLSNVIAKKEKWQELQNIFKTRGFNRTWGQLRDHYQRLKCVAKSKINKFKRHRKAGGSAMNTPSLIDWELYEISPFDFEEDEAEFYSEAFVCIVVCVYLNSRGIGRRGTLGQGWSKVN